MVCDFHRVAVLDPCGAEILRYLRLDGDRYYGGTASDHYRNLIPSAHGPHVLMTLPGMFDVVAQLAALEGAAPYALTSAGDIAQIGRVMNADRLAAILGCSPAAVLGHFGELILTREHRWMTH